MVREPVINAARRYGVKKSMNLVEYRLKDLLTISLTDNSRSGFMTPDIMFNHEYFSI